jgi:transcriptional regulator with XRE-family HTH domain
MTFGREVAVTTVHRWSGLEARALRHALRLSVRGFAEHLGVEVRTVAKWEKCGAGVQPRPDTQAIFDTALARADAAAHLRFEALLSEAGSSAQGRRVTAAGRRVWEYETWTDDLDRTVVALSRQNFASAADLLNRWMPRYPPLELDDKGLYLFARSTALLGDLRRDQGAVVGQRSAGHSYARARSIFAQLDIPRRIAQLDLSLAVVAEMSGLLDRAAGQYQALTVDERLGRRDRARARLWVGTALSKDRDHDQAVRVISAATREFEDLDEHEDWSVAQQKLALAYRGAGEVAKAVHFIGIARDTGTVDSPLQRVRLDTAHGHVLLSDRATRGDGLAVLDRAAGLAAEHGLSHQLRSIEGIRRTCERATGPGRR